MVVDDEQANLDGLSAVLNREYDVTQALNAQEALQAVSQQSFDLIITDQRMPEMLGTELLSQLAEDEPETDRLNILLTGYTDIDDLITCVNDGLLYRYLVKPWSAAELLATVNQAFDRLYTTRQLNHQSAQLEREVKERRKAQAELELTLRELKETHDMLVAQEKLRALGEMVSGVAHDFSNLLTPILAYSEELISIALTDEPIERDEWVESLKGIRDAATDGRALIERLRALYHPQHQDANQPELTHLASLIKSALKLAQPSWPSGLTFPTISLRLDDDVYVRVLSSDLRQALVNLMSNALYAIAKRQRDEALSDPLSLEIHTIREAHRVVIQVQDTGIGMSVGVLAQCKQAFFSTKGDAGTGLGLAMVNETIQRHQGQLSIDSTLGVGTCVRISLPLDEEGAEVTQ